MKLALLRGRSKSRVQALVEMAMILPLFVLLLLITIDFGRVYFSFIQINNAAREGANYAAVDPGNTPLIQTAANQETDAQRQNGETALQLVIVCKDPAGTVIACSTAKNLGSGPGNTVTVTVNEPFSFLTPFMNNFWGNSFTMSTSATSTVFGFVASGPGSPPGACPAPVANFVVVSDQTLKIYANPGSSTPVSPDPCAISGYNWTWGDGSDDVGSATGDYHTYGGANTYQVTLEVTNQAGSSTKIISVTVPAPPPPPVCAKPTAWFTWTTSGNGANTVYSYHDASTVADSVNCPITNWLWTFPGQSGSNAPNPTPFSYGNNSSHSVTLQVTNAGGSSSVTRAS